MSALSIFAPAKLNLFLAITGKRADGFHDLLSVATPLEFGDTLHAEVLENGGTGEGRAEGAGNFTFTCDDPAVPADESNLVLKAARAFVERTRWTGRVAFSLEKRVPMGAGLGGGSSDAVAALRALNELAGAKLGRDELAGIVNQLGSDCALFLHDGPVVMRGRGERIEALVESAAMRMRGRRVLVFKPAFGIPTPWAYRQLAAEAPASYLPTADAEAQLSGWISDTARATETLFYNNMERVAFGKFVALPTLLAQLRGEFRLAPRMSGSGSACFALLPDDAPVAAITATVRAAWGATSFVVETRIA